MELGPRQLTNSVRPIRTLADFKGLKIRVQPDDIHIATFRALGAEPVVVDIKDVYAQLESRTLDAQENPFAVIRDRDFHKVQRYLSHTSHFFDFIVLVAHRARFEALAPEQQRLVRAAAQEAVIAQRTAAAAEDIGAIVELNQRGMVMDPVPPSLRVQMRRATDGIVQTVRQRAGTELVDAVLEQPAQ
jgi:TRAP-type C4-dicarboxylate transport system substrate-binding protein